MAWSPNVTERDEDLATLRNDFMRRWFAIAVSVGFASTVVNMKWVQDGIWPNYGESEQIARLFVALLATVLSWEGYLTSISEKKLYDIWRYLIDILLVFMYLFLLLTSQFPYFWLSIHALTFVVYGTWDLLTAWWYRGWYSENPSAPLWRIYWNGLTASQGVNPGAVITLIWGAYFAWVWAISGHEFAYKTFVFAFFILVGLAGYRFNKGRYRGNLLFTYLIPLLAGGVLTLLVDRI